MKSCGTSTSSKLVSVVIPTFNCATYLAECIRSVLNQTYKNIEIIVVDDGSTDNTQEIIECFHGQIIYLYKRNGGVSSARNAGILKASGDYLALIDADDLWVPEKIAEQVEYLERRQNLAMVVTDVQYIDENGSPLELFQRRSIIPYDGLVLEYIFQRPFLFPSSLLIRKEVINNVGFFDERLKTAEDIDVFLRIANNYGIGLIEKPLLKYRKLNNSLSTGLDGYKNILFVLTKFINEHPEFEQNHRQSVKIAFSNTYEDYGRHLLWKGHCSEAICQLKNAMRHKMNPNLFKLYLKAHIKRCLLCFRRGA